VLSSRKTSVVVFLPTLFSSEIICYFLHRGYCNHLNLFVSWLVHSYVRYAWCDFLKSTNQIFMKFGEDFQQRSRSEFKVKVKVKTDIGLQEVILTEFKMASWWRFSLSECVLVIAAFC